MGLLPSDSLVYFRRFPRLDAITFRVGDPGELAIVVLFNLGIDRHAFLVQQLIKVLDPES